MFLRLTAYSLALALVAGVANAARAPATNRLAAVARAPAAPRDLAVNRNALPIAFDFCVNNQSGSASDSNSGADCTTNALLTIQGAVDKEGVVAGATVLVKAGTYNERVTIAKSGSVGNPITIIGECANSAATCNSTDDWLTTVKGSLDVSGSWTLCVDATCGAGFTGAGVYRKSLGYKPHNIVDADRQIFLILQRYMDGETIPNSYGGDVTGSELLQQATGATRNLTVPWDGSTDNVTVSMWDGVEALCGYKADGFTYCRYKNKDDVSAKTLRASPGAAWDQAPSHATFLLNGADYIVLKNLDIQHSQYVVALKGGANHNIIEYNKLTGGTHRVRFYGDASNNQVRNSTISARYLGAEIYGDALFEWESATDRLAQYHVYETEKFPVAETDGRASAVHAWSAGIGDIDANEISHNIILRGDKALRIDDGTNTKFHNNQVRYFWAEGIYIPSSHGRLDVYDNELFSCGQYCIRHDNGTSSSATGPTYYYRNKIYSNASDSTHPMTWLASSGDTYSPEVWFYHNSVSQGFDCIQGGTENAPNTYVINNFFSCTPITDVTWTPAVRAYNWIADGGWTTTCNGAAQSCNKTGSGELWSDTPAPDFILPTSNNGSSAIDGGINLSATFTLGGTNYSALPGMSPGYFLGSAPDAGCCERQ